MGNAQKLSLLDNALCRWQWLWQPQPFKGDPAWVEHEPRLTDALLGIDDEALRCFSQGGDGLRGWLLKVMPELSEAFALCSMPDADAVKDLNISPHALRDIPGRKWQQIQAYVSALVSVSHPLLEWCGGKGHLGRVAAILTGQPVLTIEHNATLCQEGQQLSRRQHLNHEFVVQSVFAPEVLAYLPQRHVIALHACGELHRYLVREAVAKKTPELTIAPCCYHLGLKGEQYFPMTENLGLIVSYDDLRLAVTQTVTSSPREVRKRDQEMAWKLGFDQLQRDLVSDVYAPIAPIDKQWLMLDFAGFCFQVAQGKQLTLPATIDWEHYEAVGWQRQARVMRLNLVRLAFARLLELWLVYDMAVWLAGHGYDVGVKQFCQTSLTPRNLLLQARLSQ